MTGGEVLAEGDCADDGEQGDDIDAEHAAAQPAHEVREDGEHDHAGRNVPGQLADNEAGSEAEQDDSQQKAPQWR
jgi:hypothetical protein